LNVPFSTFLLQLLYKNYSVRRAQNSLSKLAVLEAALSPSFLITLKTSVVCFKSIKFSPLSNVEKYLLGSERRLEINVEVFNGGEDAFESMFYLTIPPGLNYINIERLGADSTVAVQCSAPSSTTNNTLRCDIGNPLPSRKLVN
jgi:Integrin alpha